MRIERIVDMYLEDLFGLKNKTAVVTGGNMGIGRVVATGLAKAGAQIAILSRSSAEDAIKEIEQAGGTAYHIPTDVTDKEQVKKAIEEIEKRSGTIDVLFNNAGVVEHQISMDIDPDDFRKIIDINLNGEFIVAQACAQVMKKNHTKGSIINMASMSGYIVNYPYWQSSYNVSKAGVIHMTHCLAAEWAEYGIRVNSISPGYIATPMSTNTPQEVMDIWNSKIPMRRMGDPEELVTAILYLASSASGYSTGSDVVVDGGYICL